MGYLALKYSGFKTDGDILSFILGIALESIALFFLPMSFFYMITKEKMQLETDKFKNTFGEFYNNFSANCKWRLAYTGIYMAKRVGYVAIIVGLKDKISLQIQALFLLNIGAIVY